MEDASSIKKLRAEALLSLTRPLQLLGLFPYNVKVSEGLEICQSSNTQWRYHKTVFFFIVILNVCQILRNLSRAFSFGIIEMIMIATSSVFYCITTITMYVTILANRRRLQSILKTTLCLVQDLTIPNSFWRNFLIMNVLLTTFSFTCVFFQCYYWYTTGYEKGIALELYDWPGVIFYTLVYPLTNGLALLIANILSLHKAAFKCINASLSEITVIDDISKFLILLKFHRKITKACKDLNALFGPSLLLLFSIAASEAFYASYFAVVKGSTSDWVWLQSSLIDVAILLFMTSTTAKEAAKTCCILLISTVDFEDTTLASFAESFCLLQLHDKLHFHACSFIFLDWPLVIAMIGVVTTYTLIFVQLKK